MTARPVVFTSAAKGQLLKIPAQDREAISRAISRLAEDPRSVDVKKLVGQQGEWRLRVGRWRVLFTFDDPADSITIHAIRPRSRAYRD